MTGLKPPQAAAGIRPDSIGLAVAAMVGTDLTLSIADALIKATLGAMPLAQLVFLRSCITLPLLLVLIRWSWPRLSLRPRLPGWSVLRSALLLASLLCYYASLPLLDLSLAEAVYYTIPLFIALFAALFTGERVRVKGWMLWLSPASA